MAVIQDLLIIVTSYLFFHFTFTVFGDLLGCFEYKLRLVNMVLYNLCTCIFVWVNMVSMRRRVEERFANT